MLAGLFLPDAVFEYAAGFLYKGISGVRDEGSFSIPLSCMRRPRPQQSSWLEQVHSVGVLARECSRIQAI